MLSDFDGVVMSVEISGKHGLLYVWVQHCHDYVIEGLLFLFQELIQVCGHETYHCLTNEEYGNMNAFLTNDTISCYYMVKR